MDPANPIVQLCSQGMRAETEGRPDEARRRFQEAWERAGDDFEACVAAHYLARHQPTPEAALHWNQECLARADRVTDGRVHGFHASLHLNLAKSYSDLHEAADARRHFERAAAHVHELPAGPYADWTRFAIAEGLRSTGGRTSRPADDLLSDLIGRCRARGDLRTLGLLLPAYLGDLGTEDDRLRLVTALTMVHASRSLPDADQDLVAQSIRRSERSPSHSADG